MTILFDLDGTLINSTEAILQSFHYSYDFYGMACPSDNHIKAQIGHPLDVMYKQIGLKDKKMINNMVDAYKEHYREISTEKTILLPFAKEAVMLASRHATLGIVTTKTSKYSKVLMEHFKLMEYFDTLIGREDVINPKPSSEPIEKAISFLNVDKSNCWMIGDTRMDMQCAINANVRGVGIIGEYETTDELRKYTNIIKPNALEAVKKIISLT